MEKSCLRDVLPKKASLVDSTRISLGAKRRVVVLPARVAAARNDTLVSSDDDDGAEDDALKNAKKKKKKKIVVVGAGWAGWGAAKAVAESETAVVVLLDGVPDPTGRTGTRATSGKPFEAGVRGFWKDYPNINHLVVRTTTTNHRSPGKFFLSSKSRRTTTPLFSLRISVSLSLRVFLTPFLLFFQNAGLIDANAGIERRGRVYGVHAIEFL